MTASTSIHPKTHHNHSALSAIGMLSKMELLRLIRNPIFVVVTLLLPIMFFAMFGIPNAKEHFGQISVGQYMLVSYSAYSLMTLCLTSFGTGVANERGMGWHRLIRVAPVPFVYLFIAKAFTAVLLGLIGILGLTLFAGLVGGVTLAPLLAATIYAKLLLGMLTFSALGLAIGYRCSPISAPAISNIIFLGMSFTSGMFIPLQTAPKFLQDIAEYIPAYHFAQLGWLSLSQNTTPQGIHWLWLVGYTIVFLWIAYQGYRKDETNRV
ncbi:MAG: ABC transporter permease [Deinococcaceae bacterium]